MDIAMSIASLSTDMANAEVLDSVGAAVLKKAMDIQSVQGASLEQMMSQAQGIGKNIDISL